MLRKRNIEAGRPAEVRQTLRLSGGLNGWPLQKDAAVIFPGRKTVSPFAPRKNVCARYFRGAKGDYRKSQVVEWSPTVPQLLTAGASGTQLI